MSRKSFNESVLSTSPFFKGGPRSGVKHAVGGQREEVEICRRLSRRGSGGEVTAMVTVTQAKLEAARVGRCGQVPDVWGKSRRSDGLYVGGNGEGYREGMERDIKETRSFQHKKMRERWGGAGGLPLRGEQAWRS